MAKLFHRAKPEAPPPNPRPVDTPAPEESITDLPDRELMSLLPIAGSLVGGAADMTNALPEVEQTAEA